MSEEQRLEYACDFMREIVAHCIEGGSYRHLIYDRLGFDEAAYVPMFEAGGMEFSNACPVNMEAEVAPSIAHVGVGTIIAIDGKRAQITFGDDKKTAAIWPGFTPKVGDPALYIYLSARTYGLTFLLPIDQVFTAWKLADEREAAK